MNNNGIVSGAILVPDRFGNANSAYSFDGIDDHIEISPKDLQINNFTYSMWVNPGLFPGSNDATFFFSIGSDYSDQNILFANNYNQAQTGLTHDSDTGVTKFSFCSGMPPILGKWYHLVLSKDEDQYHFYINGVHQCSSAWGKNASYGTGTVRAIIGSRNNYKQASKAILDDIHLYNRRLSDIEIKALYNGVSPTPITLSLKSNYNSLCAGEKLKLTAEVNSTTASFKWMVDGILMPSETNEDFSYDLPDLQKDYQITVKVEAFSEECFPRSPSSEEKIISVNNCNIINPVKRQVLHVPSAFTPNNDKLNDSWEIFIPSDFPELQVLVYNRWGEVIFHSNGYTPWNGKYQDKLVIPGIYVYKITSKDKLIKFGEITIIY